MLQWEREDGITEAQAVEKLEDLDFAAVVRATEAFVLVGTHVEAVAQLSNEDALTNIVPPEAKELSAFFRVWCLVEMAAALQAAKPVVLLVGAAAGGEELRFVPNTAMLLNLFYVLDIEQAAASNGVANSGALCVYSGGGGSDDDDDSDDDFGSTVLPPPSCVSAATEMGGGLRDLSLAGCCGVKSTHGGLTIVGRPPPPPSRAEVDAQQRRERRSELNAFRASKFRHYLTL